ncbi:MAG: NADH-quinone oxidoreductase subunit NuoN [Burkholderiaceae bacterium]|jgi:NADH-quinone oxidoreductase subunit N|nr:NADH-quinone oxidoreductase subunit NuoN [Burkholderiaceae bacterium]
MMMNQYNFALALPEIFLLIASMAILVIDAFSKSPRRTLAYALSIVTLIILMGMTFAQWFVQMQGESFYGLYVVDDLSHLLKFASYIAVLATLVYGREYIQSRDMLRGGEFYVLVLMALLGQMVMISAGNFLTIYLGLELMSLALYALVAIRRDQVQATEAAMKYFVLGALASGFLLYGISMIYGATGQLDLGAVADVLRAGQVPMMPLVFGLVFIVSGLAFKLGVVPFHMWVPDVYQGAPTAVTLVLAAAPKLAAFAIALRLLVEGLGALTVDWQQMLMILAVLSLAIGNLTAIMQTNLKRMLAYSTIAHMGFVVLGLASGSATDQAAQASAYGSALFYVITYVLTTLGTFGVMLLLSRDGFECENIDDLKGLNRHNPLLAGALMFLMFSLAGIPPFLGFYSKLVILQAVLQADHLWIAIYAVMMSLIGAFYYLRVVKVMYFDEPVHSYNTGHVPTSQTSVLMFNVGLVLVFSIVPSGLITFCIQTIARSL